MILFQKIRFKNFLSTGNIFTELNLNEYKNTLIIGKNGAGKTTFLEAISYCLYGKPIRNVNKPQLVNSITQKNLLTELEFTINNKNYMVRRGMKPNVFEIFREGKLINQDSSAYDYQDILENQILKINHKSFTQIVMLSVANYTPFMQLAAAGRRQVIEDLLDIQVFSVMNSLLKDKIATNKNDIMNNDYEIKLIQNKIDLHKKHIKELNKNNKELIQARKTKIKECTSEINKTTKKIDAVLKKITSIEEKIVDANNINEKSSQIEYHTNALELAYKKLEKEIEFFIHSESCPTCKQKIDNEFKDKTLREKREKLETYDKNKKKIEREKHKMDKAIMENNTLLQSLSLLNKEISDYNVSINTNNRFIEIYEKEIHDLESKVFSIQEDNTTKINFDKELNSLLAVKEDLIRQREIYSLASQLLKDGGIKTKIVKQYIPIINKLINKYLSMMDFFVQFELDETFKETIKSRFRDEFTYDSFSQGEKLRIDLALLFTWRSVAKIRNSSSCNLLFMDEILDSSLDMGGVDEFLNIIKQFTGDTNIFIISHKGDQLYDKFENVIKVEKVKNFSRVVQ